MNRSAGADRDDATVREYDAHLAHLLADAEAACGPVAWPRVESVIGALVELYGAALGRLLASARAVAPDGSLDARIVDDELVSSLLLLHDIHPVSIEERITRALDDLRIEEPHAAPLAIVAIVDGIVRLRRSDPSTSLPPPPMYVVGRAIARVAPELGGVEIEPVGAKRSSGLVPAEHLVRRKRQ